MNKQSQHTYSGGMVQDLSKSKSPNTVFYESKNIRLNATTDSSSASITNEKGNQFILEIPKPVLNTTLKTITYNSKSLSYSNLEIETQLSGKVSGTQIIIGISEIRNHIILFTTDSNGYDCIWKVHETTFDITLLYLRDMSFNIKNKPQIINNYENSSIDKLYWVDSKNQLRFINTQQSISNGDVSELIDLNLKLLDSVSAYNTSQPVVSSIRYGGIHTSGMIQYAYNLYTVNGSQTKLSPLSELVSLNKGADGGGAVNTIVGTIPIVTINNIDSSFTNIKIYAVKYTSLNQTPSVSLIADRSVTGSNTISYPDDGNIIENLSIEQLVFLGSDIIIPKHITTKDNILFSANYSERNFEIKNLDTRAYSFSGLGATVIGDNVIVDTNNNINFTNKITFSTNNINTIEIPVNHSAINTDYDIYKYNEVGDFGGFGKNIKYSIIRSRVGSNGFTEEQRKKGGFLKDNELYRIGISFYNKYGQISRPSWIADFIVNAPTNQTNLNGYYAGLYINLKSSFYTWLNNPSNFLNEDGVYDEFLKPVGYKILRANRTDLDKTILCQGIINPMMANSYTGDFNGSDSEFAKTATKIPSLMRRFDNKLSPMLKCENYRRTHDRNNIGSGGGRYSSEETFTSVDSSFKNAKTVQFNSLMQMFSPEIEFDKISNGSLSGYKLSVIGGLLNKYNHYWGQLRNIDSRNTDSTIKVENRISYWSNNVISGLDNTRLTTSGDNADALLSGGIYAGTNKSEDINDNYTQYHQFYRRYGDIFYSATTQNNRYNFYGVPELTTKGQGITRYYNDPDLNYSMTMETFAGQNVKRSNSSDPDDGHALNNVNSHSIKSLVFVEANKKSIEQLQVENVSNTEIGLIVELKLEPSAYYINNIYKGNSYESKKSTEYIEIGTYNDISVNNYNCINPGDMFVSNYKFTKLVKTDIEKYARGSIQITEIVDVTLETTIDVDHRHDESVKKWDSRFQPRYDEYSSYNDVYSQQNTFLLRRDFNYNYKSVNKFDVGVVPSKVKIPGELIDSFTDLQLNSALFLDGKYGSINSFVNFNDQIYTLQDKALAYLSINPRVQVQGSDGIAVELGSGQVLPDYQYVNTDSGTLNKWSVVTTPSGFYYYDILNNSFNRFKGQLEGLSDAKGNHIYFQNNVVLETLKIDNPLLRTGIASGYDYINNDVYMSFLQGNKSFNIRFNESSDVFMGNVDFIPSLYTFKNGNFITTNNLNTRIYNQFKGEYNVFYDIKYPSTITLLLNPESNTTVIFDNLSFKSEVYLNNQDMFNNTLTHIRLHNEYQDSGRIPLISGRNSNLERLYRNWNVRLPRKQGSRERIRNPWTYLTLEFENTNNLKLILHDLILSYSM